MMVKTKETPKRKTVAEGGGKKFETKLVPKPKWGAVKSMGVMQDAKQLQQPNDMVVQRNHNDTGQALEHFWKYENIRS